MDGRTLRFCGISLGRDVFASVFPQVSQPVPRELMYFLRGSPLTERPIAKVASVLLKTKLLNLTADGEGSGNGEEISAFFNPIMVVAKTEMEIRCNMRADFVTDAQGRLIPF